MHKRIRKYPLVILVLSGLLTGILPGMAESDKKIYTAPSPDLKNGILVFTTENMESLLPQNFESLDWKNTYPVPDSHPFNSLMYDKLGSLNLTRTSPVTHEEFTIVMPTINKRSEKLYKILQSFIGLPKLKSVIVVWSVPEPPGTNYRWPTLHVPLKVVHPEDTSLNNRFLPLNIIETEAVLSLDDEIVISHEEILIAFDIWRERRDQIVGYPGREALWNMAKKEWEYKRASLWPCSKSIVLTSCAFLHKKYLSIYTYEMPKVIRDRIKIDRNCEDIAMNFLVSHITRKPPILVTRKIQFQEIENQDRSSLSARPNHYKKRNQCLNFFEKIFGYMPLIRTEYRSVDLYPADGTCGQRSKQSNPPASYYKLARKLTRVKRYKNAE